MSDHPFDPTKRRAVPVIPIKNVTPASADPTDNFSAGPSDDDDRDDDTIRQNFSHSMDEVTDSVEPTDVPVTTAIDHQAGDSNIDMTELYDEGFDGATETEDPLHRPEAA